MRTRTQKPGSIAHMLFGELSSAVGRTFARMGVAEEELARAFPGRAGEPRELFLALCPTEAIREFGDELYRAHVRELCNRAKAGGDLALLTKAEVLAGLSTASLKAPLNGVGERMASTLLHELMPRAADVAFPGGPEKVTGYDAVELHDELRRALGRCSNERAKALKGES